MENWDKHRRMPMTSIRAVACTFFGLSLLAPRLSWPADSENCSRGAIVDTRPSPFKKFLEVARGIHVFDASQFVPNRDPNMWLVCGDEGVYARQRIGLVVISPGKKYYLDSVTPPMGEYFEFINPITGRADSTLPDREAGETRLLFNGLGVVYEQTRAPGLCSGTITRKHELREGALVEVPQALLLVSDGETEVLDDIKIYFNVDERNTPVASLPRGSKVTVIAVARQGVLIKTPLGLSGWLPNDAIVSLLIRQCE